MSEKKKPLSSLPKYHPLFPPRENEDELSGLSKTPYASEITAITVLRRDPDKIRSAPNEHDPAVFQTLKQLLDMYGGGTYDLVAKDSQNVMRRRVQYVLEGPSKPLNGEPVASSEPAIVPVVSALPLNQPQDMNVALIGLLGTIVQASMQQTGAIIAAIASGNSKQVDPMSYLAPVIEAFGKLQQSQTPPPLPVVPAPATASPTSQVREVLGIMKEVKDAMPEKEESATETINAIGGFVAPIVSAILQRQALPMPAPVG